MAILLKSANDIKKCENWAISRIREIEDAYDARHRVSLEHYMNYNSKTFKKFYNGRADVFVPLSFQLVEIQLARFMRAIYQQKIPYDLEGIGPINILQEEKMKGLIDVQQKQFAKMYIRHLDYFRSMFIYGRGYGKMKWRTKYQKVTKLFAEESVLPEGSLSIPKHIKVSSKQDLVLKYDSWEFTPVDYFDMFVDPLAKDGDLQNANFVAEKRIIDWTELKELGSQLDGTGKPLYMNFDDMHNRGDGALTDEDISRKLALGMNVTAIDAMRQDGKKHEIHEIWCHYDVDSDGIIEQNVILTLLDRKRIIRADFNPLWHGDYPYISSSMYRIPNEFLSQGLLDHTRKIQYEINDKRNQSLDFGTMSLNAAFIAGDGAGVEDNQIRMTQHGVIRVRDASQLTTVKFPAELMQLAEQANLIMESNMRDAVGSTRSLAGLPQGGPRQTASQFTQTLAQAGERGRLALDTYAEEAHGEIPKHAHALNQQFLRRDMTLRLTEDQQANFKELKTGQVVTRADLAMDLAFKSPNFADIESEAIRNQNLSSMLQIVQTLPDTPPNRVLLQKLIHKIWTDQFNFDEKELFDNQGQVLDFSQQPSQAIDGNQTASDEGGPVQSNEDFSANDFADDLASAANGNQ